MNFNFTPEQKSWQKELRDFLKENVTPDLKAEMHANKLGQDGPLVIEFRKKMAKKGWNGVNWPKEYGGLEKTAVELVIFKEEFDYFGAPSPRNSQMMTGPAIIRKGTKENIEQWIPRIIRGEVETSLGYSEPNAGTDLANLQTRAQLDGNEWVINGQKTWNTKAHTASHHWLAVRTDPEAPKHKGISMVMVPVETPGISVREIKHWGHHRTNEVFFDNVRVPKDYLIGEVNKGWDIITNALNFERVTIGSSSHIRRVFDELVRYCKRTVIDGQILINKPNVRMRISELAVDFEVARLFAMRAASMIDAGVKDIASEASMMKVFTTELETKVADWGMQIIDLYGQLNSEDEHAPLSGIFEEYYRRAPLVRFGGGANEIQRNIIARHGLKLPRQSNR